MPTTLKEQLAAACAAFKPHAEEQTRLSEASAKINAEIRRLQKLKRDAEEAAEHSAQVGARRLLGEATDEEAQAARDASEAASREAEGVDRALAQLNREHELVHVRYQAAVPQGVAAQNVCNQLRAAILMEEADRAAEEYVAAAKAMCDALVKVLGCSKAMERVPGGQGFAPRPVERVELPAFPALTTFRPSPHQSFVVAVGSPSSVGEAADSVLRRLRAEGVQL